MHYVATSIEPWLELRSPEISRFAGRFVELTYRASLLDEPARPIFRFTAANGSFTDHIGAAPIAGAAVWAGRVPANTTQLAISPTNRPGAFAFRLERLRVRRASDLFLDGARRRPRHTFSALLTRCIGWTPESDNNLAWAIGATDLDAHDEWLARRARPLQAGIDTPRFAWSAAAPIRVIVAANGNDEALAHTLASLRRQAFDRLDIWVIGTTTDDLGDDPRVVILDLDGVIDRLGASEPGVLVGAIEAGDTLPPHALAFLAEQRNRHPSVRVFYGDEIAAGQPVLKPGWSPRFATARSFLGRAVFASGLDGWDSEARRRFVTEGEPPLHMLASDATDVQPLRRILLDRPHAFRPGTTRSAQVSTSSRALPNAAIVILTRDHPALLSRVVASIRAKSHQGRYRILIVDNGEPDGPAKNLMTSLEQASDVLLLRRPEPFNFSRFCNEAAAACDEPLLVFLNDDTEVLSDSWLDRLAANAFDGTVGAVGAKLTFPDGRIQHVGVLVGMGGSAGHFGAMAPGDDPGWHGRNQSVHEVSAVTGACLAVTREKFEAVGGFDAEHLPVELSDIDLCLKLNARGWQTIVDPQVRLLHEESASRGGATFRRLDKYSEQRDIFIDRWRHVLRDDPAFHPGLSLYSLKAALG